jgi:hypothetical protein
MALRLAPVEWPSSSTGGPRKEKPHEHRQECLCHWKSWSEGQRYKTKQNLAGMGEGEEAGVGVVFVGDRCETKAGELGGDFGGAFGGFGFDDESMRAPRGDGDLVGATEFAGGVEPGGIVFAGEEGHGLSIGNDAMPPDDRRRGCI